MPMRSKVDEIAAQPHYASLLATHPLFRNSPKNERQQLAGLFTTELFQSGDILVAEGSIVDSIYFIISGRAEVKKFVLSNGKNEMQPIAVLSSGDSIGLTDKGIFSSTGARTATIIALEKVVAIKLDIKQFHDFLATHPDTHSSILDNVNLLLRMHFLKEAAPFSELPISRLHQLAERVEEITVPQGTTLFEEGDIGNDCYLISSGRIEISINDESKKKILSELETHDIFGEAALLLDIPRNATALALETSTLLVLNRILFIDLIGSETSTSESLMLLQHVRSRPLRVPHAELFTQKKADGEEIITLKNSAMNKYFRLSKYGLFIWERLNGANSLNDITIAFYKKFNIFNPGAISNIILDLHRNGFIYLDRVNAEQSMQKLPFVVKSLIWIRRFAEARWALSNVDAWLTRTYQRYIWIFYTRVGQFLLALIAMSGFIVFALHFSHAANLLNASPVKWRLLFFAYALSLFTFVLHELAHAYTTKAFGRHVYCFGVGWFWLRPMAFCDTSDMWLSSKKARVAVDLAGIYLNLIVAGIAGWCMLPLNAEWTIVFWIFALINYLTVMANLSPAMELDGYYTLMDILDKPNLRELTIEWLVDDVFNSNRPRNSFFSHLRQHWEAVIYCLITIVYIIFIGMILPYIIANYLLHGFFDVRNPFISLLVVCGIVLLSGLSMWGELKKKRAIK
jgi:CRP-like cAMP-binding protein